MTTGQYVKMRTKEVDVKVALLRTAVHIEDRSSNGGLISTMEQALHDAVNKAISKKPLEWHTLSFSGR